jgi:hypothetical protein
LADLIAVVSVLKVAPGVGTTNLLLLLLLLLLLYRTPSQCKEIWTTFGTIFLTIVRTLKKKLRNCGQFLKMRFWLFNNFNLIVFLKLSQCDTVSHTVAQC